MTIATSRQRLPARRANQTFSLECAALKFTACVLRFDGGQLGEVFISNYKAGSAAGIMASDAGDAASLAKQYGCPVVVQRKASSRDAHGAASVPRGIALDPIEEERP